MEKIFAALGLQTSEVINIYPYGSRIYGTHKKNSDWDYIVVVNEGLEKREVKTADINATIYNRNQFLKERDLQEISILECLSLPKEIIILEKEPFEYEVNLAKLRQSVSAKASNSFVKAKKKLVVEADFDLKIAWKSLFHSLRILMFGIQLAENGKIDDYSRANHFLDEIEDLKTTDWDILKEKYQPIYNQLSTEFKKRAPKN